MAKWWPGFIPRADENDIAAADSFARDYCRAFRLRQTDLAALIGIERSTISRLANGDCRSERALKELLTMAETDPPEVTHLYACGEFRRWYLDTGLRMVEVERLLDRAPGSLMKLWNAARLPLDLRDPCAEISMAVQSLRDDPVVPPSVRRWRVERGVDLPTAAELLGRTRDSLFGAEGRRPNPELCVRIRRAEIAMGWRDPPI